ncbi:MAG: hypothetical protein IPG44_17825 [Anaerolineales bacterium]|nr:hypothetical protein [Anaerolineales bacterium]
MTHVLLRHRDIPDIAKLNVYKKNGGFDALKRAVTKMQPTEVIDVVKASGLRGRGGAGFDWHEVVVHRQQELASLCCGKCG